MSVRYVSVTPTALPMSLVAMNCAPRLRALRVAGAPMSRSIGARSVGVAAVSYVIHQIRKSDDLIADFTASHYFGIYGVGGRGGPLWLDNRLLITAVGELTGYGLLVNFELTTASKKVVVNTMPLP